MITEKTIFKGKKLEGYPRLKHTAKRIADYIPKCSIYCEPFAGLGEVARYVTAETKILNDKSEYAYQYLRKEFPRDVIRDLDFKHCMDAYDTPETFFLIDPPWYNDIYSKNDKPFYDRTALQYYEDIFNILEHIKGDWTLCADKWEHDVRRICTKSKYDNLILKTDVSLLHGKIGVLLTSNKPFTKGNVND